MKSLCSFKSNFIVAVLAGVFAATGAIAQQEPLYSQYMFNTLAINPAYAGNRDVLSITALGRYQWLGIDGAPTTFSFTADMPFKNEKMGIGITAFNDGLGHSNNTGVGGAYSYKFRLGENTTMSLGVSASVTNISWLLSRVENINELDPVFQASSDISKIYPNVGGGFFISNDRSYLGFSVPQIIETKLNLFVGDNKARVRRHYYTMMGIVFGNGDIKVKPSMMFRYTDGSPLGIDGNVNLWIKDKISFGISGRKSQAALNGVDLMDAAVGMFELQLTPQLRFGYSFDYNLTNLNDTDKTGKSKFQGFVTHEGLLRYEFGYGKNKIVTPRYF